jgi:hypothetical protein
MSRKWSSLMGELDDLYEWVRRNKKDLAFPFMPKQGEAYYFLWDSDIKSGNFGWVIFIDEYVDPRMAGRIKSAFQLTDSDKHYLSRLDMFTCWNKEPLHFQVIGKNLKSHDIPSLINEFKPKARRIAIACRL